MWTLPGRAKETEHLSFVGPRAAARTFTPLRTEASGTRVMINSMIQAVNGKVHFNWRAEGLECRIVLSLS
jgi:hypothetical protein